MEISIIGVGRLGEALVRNTGSTQIFFYDIDRDRISSLERKGFGNKLDSLSSALDKDIVLFALPGKEILNILRQNYLKISPQTLLVNLSTSLTLKELEECCGNLNFLSCKIIGESDQIQKGGKVTFIIHKTEKPVTGKISVVTGLFRLLGHVIVDDEKKYLNVNYLAAEKIMKTALEFAVELKKSSFPTEVISAAILGVMMGTL
jgi:pyrroline-5-carboxylate reductase